MEGNFIAAIKDTDMQKVMMLLTEDPTLANGSQTSSPLLEAIGNYDPKMLGIV